MNLAEMLVDAAIGPTGPTKGARAAVAAALALALLVPAGVVLRRGRSPLAG